MDGGYSYYLCVDDAGRTRTDGSLAGCWLYCLFLDCWMGMWIDVAKSHKNKNAHTDEVVNIIIIIVVCLFKRASE